MNSADWLQTIGNLSILFGGLLFGLPLQYLLLESSRKREDGGGILAATIILLPMWLCLLVGLLCVVSMGGFDGLHVGRPMLFILTTKGMVSMACIAFFRFEFQRSGNFLTRFLSGVPIQLFPSLTILLVALKLNPSLRVGSLLQLVSFAWTTCAALSLALCMGYVGFRLIRMAGNQCIAAAHILRGMGQSNQNNLTLIQGLDTVGNFAELLRMTGEFHSRAVRDAAMVKLRSSANFIDQLIAELNQGKAEDALAAVEYGVYSPIEQDLLGLPARKAMKRMTAQLRSELRFIPKARRRATLRWGKGLFRSIAKKLKRTGVDFQPAIAAFERTFDTPGANDH